MNFDTGAMARRMKGLVARTGNMPEEMRRQAIEEHLEADWEAMMGKVPGYLAGRHLVEGRDASSAPGFFNLMSLGDWITIAGEAGVRCVPARLLAVLDPMIPTIMSMNGNTGGFEHLSEAQRANFLELVQEVNGMKRSEILRFDCCASGKLKFVLQEDGVPDEGCRGLVDMGSFKAPDFEDQRFAEQFLWYNDKVMPVWARPWVKAMRIPAATSPMMPKLPPIGTRPVEWRFYVRDGRIEAVSQYYPHATITEAEARGRYGLDAALEACGRMLSTLSRLALVPHHPRHELRDDLDPAGLHCSIDVLVTPEGVPMLLEAGPPHLRNPNWGSHPCNFGVDGAPAGIAPRLRRPHAVVMRNRER